MSVSDDVSVQVAARQAPRGDVAPAARDKTRQILTGAREVFLAQGFDGASMGEIARAAGVSKGTLYVYFASKEELFAALVREQCGQTAESCFVLDPDEDVASALTALSHRYIRAMMQSANISTVRMVIGVAEKLPEIGRAYYASAQEQAVALLSDWLRLKIARGELAIDDVELAAWQFVVGCHSRIVMANFFCGASASEQEIERVVTFTVTSFMSAFGRRRRATDRPA